MNGEGQTGAGSETIPSLGFVAVLDERGRAEEILKRIVPDADLADCHTNVDRTLAFAADTTRRDVVVKRVGQLEVVLLGNLVSEQVRPEEALDWAVSAVTEDRYDELKTLQGVYVLVVVDSTRQSVTVVSDLLGMKPFYVARRAGMTILSDRAEAAPRLGGASIDALGMAGWLYFGHPLVNRTLFDSVERIAPSSVTVFEAQSTRQKNFWTPTVAEEPVSAHDLAEGVFQDFTNSLRRLLKPFKAGTVLLSGGFDSRLCLLTCLRDMEIAVDAVTVPYTENERRIVDELVTLTGIDCRRVDIKRSVWDEFDSMWLRHPDGFIRWRNLCYLTVPFLAKQGAFIDGSHSDVSVRFTRAEPQQPETISREEAREHVWQYHTRHNVESYLRSGVVTRFEQLARQAANEQSEATGWSSKLCRLWNIQTDERRNIAFNHLQYAHMAPSIQPFYDRTLMERRLRHPSKAFEESFYRALLKQQFPGKGELPHAEDLPKGVSYQYGFSKTLWCHLPRVARFVHRHRDIMRRRSILPRIAAYGLGRRRHMYMVLELMRYVLLEEEMKRFGIDLDFGEGAS